MKKSEARILVYLSQVLAPARYPTNISIKLDIDYAYLHKIMRGLENKELVSRASTHIQNKVFYNITSSGEELLQEAKERLAKR